MMDGNNVSRLIKIMAQEPLKVKDYKEIKNKGNYLSVSWMIIIALQSSAWPGLPR
jgi:hypothetical protein